MHTRTYSKTVKFEKRAFAVFLVAWVIGFLLSIALMVGLVALVWTHV
ncbi:MAG: hypothetical protein ACXVGB_00035 [Mycobacteriaceae bacterium]